MDNVNHIVLVKWKLLWRIVWELFRSKNELTIRLSYPTFGYISTGMKSAHERDTFPCSLQQHLQFYSIWIISGDMCLFRKVFGSWNAGIWIQFGPLLCFNIVNVMTTAVACPENQFPLFGRETWLSPALAVLYFVFILVTSPSALGVLKWASTDPSGLA